MGLLDCIGMRVGFGIWSWIPLFCSVAPMRDIAKGDVWWFGVNFRNGRGRGELWWGWGFLVYMGHIIRKGL